MSASLIRRLQMVCPRGLHHSDTIILALSHILAGTVQCSSWVKVDAGRHDTLLQTSLAEAWIMISPHCTEGSHFAGDKHGVFTGVLTGLAWKGIESWMQVSTKNKMLVSRDWLMTKMFGRDTQVRASLLILYQPSNHIKLGEARTLIPSCHLQDVH